VEPSREAEDAWTKTCEEIANMTLFPKVESWIFGANIPGKKKTVMLGPSQSHFAAPYTQSRFGQTAPKCNLYHMHLKGEVPMISSSQYE
jgi:hypothetical protein